MKPPPLDYVAPDSLDEALAVLADSGEDAKLIAGGQSLLPLLSLRMARPTVLIDLDRVPGLGSIERTNGSLRVGAMTRHRAVERSPTVRESVPLLSEAMPLIGHDAIRTRGTVGGSMAHADPAAELPAVATAAGATFTAVSRDRGERTLEVDDFFDGYFTTTLEPDEILVAIDFPVTGPDTGSCIEEVARRHGDFAMTGALVTVTVTDGIIGAARIALLNMAETPLRARSAEDLLVGNAPGAEVFADAAQAAVRDLSPNSDLHASAAYRRKVGAVCVRRALTTAATRAQENR